MRYRTRVVMAMLGLQLVLVSSCWAFAVGEIAVQSRRGEAFVATIRLLLDAREKDKEIAVSLGDQEAYGAEGLSRPALLDTLKAVVSPEARQTIHLTSTVPLQESAFDLVLAVRAGQVTIVKYYRVTVPDAAPVLARVPSPLPTIVPLAPAAKTTKTPAKAVRPLRRPERYGPIERGETLYSVAKALHAPNDKLWQIVVVLWRNNKGQFQGGNLHGLQVGTSLEVPADLVDQIATLRIAEAQEIIADQWEEWHTMQRSGLGKARVIAAARDADAPTPAAAKRDAVAKREATAGPVDKPVEKPATPQTMVLPVGKHGNTVSMAELQTVLQGLEERLLRRMIPTAQVQEVKSPTAFVSTSELQTSIQNLEDRLTQRMQQLLVQTPEPVRVGQILPHQVVPVVQPTLTMEPTQSASLLMIPYLLVLTNVLLLLLVGVLVWFWLRRRDRAERMQRI